MPRAPASTASLAVACTSKTEVHPLLVSPRRPVCRAGWPKAQHVTPTHRGPPVEPNPGTMLARRVARRLLVAVLADRAYLSAPHKTLVPQSN